MVDAKPPPTPGTPPAAFAGERSKIKLFMERTPSIGALKSKFLTVLGNSNELLNGISNKLTLSSSSSDSDYCDDDEEVPKFDESIDYTKIDFEARRVKARRAHEEIISGRYRQPNLAPRPRLEHARARSSHKAGGDGRRSSSLSSSTSSSSDSSSLSLPGQPGGTRSHISSTTRSNSIESRHSGGYERPRAIAGARRSELDMQKDRQRISELLESPPHIDVQPPTDGERGGTAVQSATSMGRQSTWAIGVSSNSMRVPTRSRTSNSSTLTSLRDEPEQLASPSVESTDWRNFIRSESQNSVPSWASSISLDCRAGEEPVKEFMKNFTELIFNNCQAVDLELKSEFGVLVRMEMGRQWFTRFLSEQRNKSKRLNGLTFHALAQYFALTLFECGECEDYSPAAVLVNLCFLFYHEIEVPGCEPYREYLFLLLRRQPIWQQSRFWNAIFHEALQAEREHRVTARLRRQERKQQKQTQRNTEANANASSSSSHHSNLAATALATATAAASACASRKPSKASLVGPGAKEQEDIAFRQLGAFTCNMHSLGTTQETCLEFLKKHVVALNLSKDKAKLVRDNINRMYRETELWGAQST